MKNKYTLLNIFIRSWWYYYDFIIMMSYLDKPDKKNSTIFVIEEYRYLGIETSPLCSGTL